MKNRKIFARAGGSKKMLHSSRWKLRGIAALLSVAVGSSAFAATYTYVDTADNGLWTTAASWSPTGPPASQSDIVVGTHSANVSNPVNIGLSGSGVFNQTGGSVVVSNGGGCTINLGVNTAGIGTYNLSGGSLIVDQINVGLAGNGTLDISNSTPNITAIDVGGSTGTGVLNLGPGSVFNNYQSVLYVASNGTVNFQTGATSKAPARALLAGRSTFSAARWRSVVPMDYRLPRRSRSAADNFKSPTTSRSRG